MVKEKKLVHSEKIRKNLNKQVYSQRRETEYMEKQMQSLQNMESKGINCSAYKK